jgi:hypothetical protein
MRDTGGKGALRRAGGPYLGGSPFRFTWEGARFTKAVDESVKEALDVLSDQIRATLKAELHRWPKHTVHHLADDSFAIVTIRAGRRTLILGSEAPYALWHEYGTRWYQAHPQIREIARRYIDKITPTLRAASAKRGL